MAKITWTFKNEEGTNLNRYIATNISTGEKITFDLLRGGNISVVGTPLNAENLNALITSINACYDLISSSEKDTTYTLSKNGNAIRLTSSSGAINDVTLDKSDVGLGNVDNTSDKDKPISTAQQQGLNKPLYNLGAFDTISGNVITRQTGYVDLGKLDYESNSGSYPSNSFYFTISSAKPNGRLSLSSSSLFDNVYFDTSSNLILLLNNTYNNANDLKSALSGIILQYELATSYTEEIIEGQPLITLDQQGSQWLRDEWGKGINLFNNDGNISLNGIGLVVGNTYTLSNNESQFLIKISILEGSTTSLAEANNTNKVTFVWDGQVNNVYFFNNDYTTKKLTDYQIMLNEGDHPYPYQPYKGSLVHSSDLEAVKSELNQVVSTNTSNISSLQTSVSANTSSISTNTNNIATNSSNISTIQNAINTKANTSDVYTKSQTYTKEETNALIDAVIDGEVELTNYYTKTETDARIDEKLDEKQTTECNCSHEVEITRFGEEDCNLLIDDQDVVITKIQGQTRRKSANLFDYNNTFVGDLAINGAFNPSATAWWSSDFIKVKPNTNYAFSVADNFINYYDTNKNFINFQRGLSYYTTPNNCYYVRINGIIETQPKEKVMLNEGSTALPYEPYDNTLVNSKCDFVSTGRNLWDEQWEQGNISNDTGENLLASDRIRSKNYIKAIPNTSYTLNDGVVSFYYDINKNFISTGNHLILTPSNCHYIRFRVSTDYGNVYKNDIMLNYGNTTLPYEPYVEDTMKCGLELGAFDYHDNVNHITHRQTSGIITLNGSENWRIMTESNGYGLKVFGINIEKSAFSNTDNSIGVSNNGYAVKNTDNNWVQKNTIGVTNNDLYIGSDSITTVNDFKSWLQANPITLVYKLANETTEENILPSGYKVWYKGMQIQKTETIPYILTKQYAISLASQVLNNVSIDRSQQKQIDELKETKLNSTTSDGISVESLLELFRDNVTTEVSVSVFAKTGTINYGEHYIGSGSITILPNSTNKKISNLTITDIIGKANASYNETAGVISYNLYNKNANTKTSGIIKYTITINQYLEN